MRTLRRACYFETSRLQEREAERPQMEKVKHATNNLIVFI